MTGGNIHLNVVPPEGMQADAVERLFEEAEAEIFAVVDRYGGSISAEHGIGRAKAALLHLSRSPAEIAAMRAVKAALDPDDLLNPGVLLPRA